MKIKVVAEHPLERIVLALGLAPVTLVDTHMSFLRARAIMVGTKLGVFDALAAGPRTAKQIATTCGTDPHATVKLLSALVGSGYVAQGGVDYSLTAVARKWALTDSPQSLRDKILFEFIEWKIVEGVEDYVRTGRPADLHGGNDPEEWRLYQRAMRALAGMAAPEVVKLIPVPPGATAMLDIGGSHGFYSVCLCRKHPGLSSVILDLPDAVAQAAPILARENMGDRVRHRAGSALTDDLGDQAWDLVIMAQLAHHFDDEANRRLATRVAQALKPGGAFVILELLRPASAKESGQVGALLDLYFALTSQSGTWSVAEMQQWQRDAGLTVRKPVFLRTMPGAAAVIATRART
ncbi:MAG: methyltransferase [Acidobacteriota bacterium]